MKFQTCLFFLFLWVAMFFYFEPASCGSLLNAYMSQQLGHVANRWTVGTKLDTVPTIFLGYIATMFLQYFISFFFGAPFLVQVAFDFLEVYILAVKPAWSKNLTLEALAEEQRRNQATVTMPPQIAYKK